MILKKYLPLFILLILPISSFAAGNVTINIIGADYNNTVPIEEYSQATMISLDFFQPNNCIFSASGSTIQATSQNHAGYCPNNTTLKDFDNKEFRLTVLATIGDESGIYDCLNTDGTHARYPYHSIEDTTIDVVLHIDKLTNSRYAECLPT